MNENEEKQTYKEKKEIEVINGDGKELDISPAYEHIKSDKLPHNEKKGTIIIPKSTSNDNDNDN